jgi:mycofactocin system glycosyltransferase
VLVVDDASRETERIREVCKAHGARVLHRDVNGGPAAARNTGLAAVATPFVAFLDSDCEPAPDWLASLVGHLDDPQVCAVAPCVRPLPERAPTGRTSVLSHYLDRRCALDLGEQHAAVRPMSPVPYVPTAALLVRRSVLADGFDESLRYGEDVDLVWRLQASGLQVRYDPSVVVRHREPRSWVAMLGRRFRYGTSVGPLTRRHPGHLSPMLAAPLPVLIAAALLLRQPLVALLIAAAGSANLAWKLHRLGISAWRGPMLVTTSLLRLSRDVLRTAVMLYAPLLLLLVAVSGHPWTIAALSCLPYLAEWFQSRPRLDPLRWTAARIIEDVAYGCGVWVGCMRSRSLAPLLPRIVSHRVRRSGHHPPPSPRP